ncbi:MAG: conserved rane protein of unknown function [Chthoniobacteraceae bacterium]|nr:conserved rane protein of unknown function [Chthoniobacteraceae bacterium]
MKKAREVEFEVLPKNRTLTGDDPLIALVARLMDSVFTLPGTKIRFGLDPLIGLIPGVGDTASAVVSMLLIFQSARYGMPRIVLARMALNVLLNTIFGSVPVIGDFFSLWFKSNNMNYALLRKHAGQRRTASSTDWLFVIGLLALLLGAVVLVIIGAVTLIRSLFP